MISDIGVRLYWVTIFKRTYVLSNYETCFYPLEIEYSICPEFLFFFSSLVMIYLYVQQNNMLQCDRSNNWNILRRENAHWQNPLNCYKTVKFNFWSVRIPSWNFQLMYSSTPRLSFLIVYWYKVPRRLRLFRTSIIRRPGILKWVGNNEFIAGASDDKVTFRGTTSPTADQGREVIQRRGPLGSHFYK